MDLDFTSLKLGIPENICNYSIETQNLIYNYLLQLNELEKKAYMIAFNHLGTSFHITRSTGYMEWLKKEKENEKEKEGK